MHTHTNRVIRKKATHYCLRLAQGKDMTERDNSPECHVHLYIYKIMLSEGTHLCVRVHPLLHRYLVLGILTVHTFQRRVRQFNFTCASVQESCHQSELQFESAPTVLLSKPHGYKTQTAAIHIYSERSSSGSSSTTHHTTSHNTIIIIVKIVVLVFLFCFCFLYHILVKLVFFKEKR